MGNKTNKSPDNILVINDGKTRDFPSKIMNYLERYTESIDLRDLRDFQPGELEEEIQNYDKKILICNIGFRMRLNQEEMIRDLDKQIQNNLQVFYLLKQGAGSYDITDCKAWQVNVFLHEFDERFIEKSLKDFVNADRARKWRRIKFMILFLLVVGLLVSGYLYFKSAPEENEAERHEKLETEILKLERNERFEKLKADTIQLSEDCKDLIQANERLVEENLEIQQRNEQKYLIRKRNIEEKLEEVEKSILTLKKDDQSTLESQEKKAHQISEEIQKRYEEELKEKRELEKENLELRLTELVVKGTNYEELRKKLNDQENENQRSVREILNQCEELRNAEQQKIRLSIERSRQNLKNVV